MIYGFWVRRNKRMKFRNCRIPCAIRSFVDNAAVLGSANKLFTTSEPLTRFIHVLLKELHLSNLRLDLEWIATDENSSADDISRNKMHWTSSVPNFECHVHLNELMSDPPQARGAGKEEELKTRRGMMSVPEKVYPSLCGSFEVNSLNKKTGRTKVTNYLN